MAFYPKIFTSFLFFKLIENTSFEKKLFLYEDQSSKFKPIKHENKKPWNLKKVYVSIKDQHGIHFFSLRLHIIKYRLFLLYNDFIFIYLFFFF